MTEEKKPNKSKLIRDYIELHPNAAPKQIVADLSKFGVTTTDVGNVRTKLKNAKKKSNHKNGVSKIAPSPAVTPKTTTPGITLKAIESAALLLKEAGSLSNAKEILFVVDQARSV